MNRKYVVFWIPTIIYTELREIKTEMVVDISDNSPHPYYVKFTLCENGNIIITSKVSISDSKFEEFDIPLMLCEKRSNGFIQFYFDEDTIPENWRKLFEYNLSNAFYHIIKEFWHEHESHTGKDSYLFAKISSHPIDLTEDDNPALVGFLEDFSEFFCSNEITVSFLNRQINILVRKFEDIKPNRGKISVENRQVLKKMYEDIVRYVKLINDLCEDSLIGYNYCKTLLSCIQNKSFKYDIELNANEINFDIKNSFRRKALNIQNSIKNIETIKSKNQNRLNTLSFTEVISLIGKIDETLNNDKKWQRIGISLAVYSILSTLLFGFKDNIQIIQNWFNILLIIISVLLGLFLFFDIPKYISYCWKLGKRSRNKK